MAFVEPITIKEAVESIHKKKYLLDELKKLMVTAFKRLLL